MPGQVTGRWTVHACRLTILSDDLHFAARPRVSLNVTVDRGRGEKREKKRREKSYRIRENAKEEDFIWLASWRNEEERREEKIREGRKVFTVFDFVFILHTWREITEREREREV